MKVREPRSKRAPCPCGAEALWRRIATSPEAAPEGAVCFLTDADFSDDYCDACFARAVPEAERALWQRWEGPPAPKSAR